MNVELVPRHLFAGLLTRDFVILSGGKVLMDVPGGNLLYAASGLAVWEQSTPPGLIARVGEDYPQEWLEEFRRQGMDTRGIRILSEAIDLRNFYIYTDLMTRKTEDPVEAFARLNMPFPKALLGFRKSQVFAIDRTRLPSISLRQADIPADYEGAIAAHLCPVDFLTHSLLPAVMRQAGLTTVTLDPCASYMTPIYWNDVPSLVTGLTAFIPSEEELRALFQGRSTDLWEMAETVASWGCDFVVIKRGQGGQFLFDASTKAHWDIPAYPARLSDVTGAGDSFCGGFLAGYTKSYDPLQAVLHGNISTSLAIEGQGPFYSLQALQGLAQARLEALKENVRRI